MAQAETWKVKGRIDGQQNDTQKRLKQMEERLSRGQRFDRNVAAMREHQSLQDLLNELTMAADRLQQVLRERGVEEKDTMLAFAQREDHRKRKQDRREEIEQHGAYAQRLVRAQQVVTPMCQCGQHHGITFKDNDETLAENVCPKDWWITQARVALSNGGLTAFTSAYPFEDYVGAYRLDGA